MAKMDKYDLLASVIDAIYDENKKVLVETTTLDANRAKRYAWNITDRSNPQIPTYQGAYKSGVFSKNHEHAESIKIGNISMRRLSAGNSWKYIVRTPDGEAEFSQNDDDFLLVWSGALAKYDMRESDTSAMSRIMDVLYKRLKNEKLKDAAGKGIVRDNKKTKFEKAKEQLKALGVKAKDEDLKKRLAAIQNHGMEM